MLWKACTHYIMLILLQKVYQTSVNHPKTRASPCSIIACPCSIIPHRVSSSAVFFLLSLLSPSLSPTILCWKAKGLQVCNESPNLAPHARTRCDRFYCSINFSFSEAWLILSSIAVLTRYILANCHRFCSLAAFFGRGLITIATPSAAVTFQGQTYWPIVVIGF